MDQHQEPSNSTCQNFIKLLVASNTQHLIELLLASDCVDDLQEQQAEYCVLCS